MKKVTLAFIKFLSTALSLSEKGSSIEITFPSSETERVTANVKHTPLPEDLLNIAVKQWGVAVGMHAEDEDYKVQDIKFFIERRENSIFSSSNFTGEVETPLSEVGDPVEVLLEAVEMAEAV